jgi:CubicO group peptidase (beta-lactamase class C family)
MKKYRFYSLTLVLVLFPIISLAGMQKSKMPADTIKKIEEIIESEKTKLGVPGLSVAVAVDNQIHYSKGFGMADLENSVPAKAETVYRTASIAKSMTATAVMQLVEQGKIDLDSPVQKYCQAFPEKQWPVTTRQLLGHLAGVRHYKAPGESSGTKSYFAIVDSMNIFKDDPLLQEPGTKFNYTTYGYTVLGCVIEGASGMSYEDYMREKVFGPAGMSSTRTDNFRIVIPNRARGYARLSEQGYNSLTEAAKKLAKPGEIYNASLHDTSMKIPGGGLVSTAVDLVKFAIAVNNGTLVKKATAEQMWTEQKTKDGQGTTYGLGWVIGKASEYKLVSHSGGQAGTSTLLIMLPEKGIVVAAMANLEGVPLESLTRQIGSLVLSQNQAQR